MSKYGGVKDWQGPAYAGYLRGAEPSGGDVMVISLLATRQGTGAFAQNNAVDNTPVQFTGGIDAPRDFAIVPGDPTLFTCTRTGAYFVNATIATDPDGVTAAWGNIVGLRVMIDGVASPVLSDWHTSLSTSNFGNVSGRVLLQAGEQLSVQCKNTSGVNSLITSAQLAVWRAELFA
jgi:hypothetical protein